jgi:hypothetical protein
MLEGFKPRSPVPYQRSRPWAPKRGQAAWLLVQHADHDPAFQRVCLELLGGAVRAGEADVRHHAYLTDRVLLAEGR